MKFKSVLLLAVAVGCGLVAMLGVRQLLAKPADESTQRVMVATTEISAGFPLDETNVGFKTMPIDLVPEGAVTSWEEIADRALQQGAFPEDVITEAKLGDKGQGNASAKIPKGWRVVTVPVDLTKTHSGLLHPGDRVDLQVTYKKPSLNHGMENHTTTFLEYVEVFATDSLRSVDKTNDAEIKAKNISLLVTPEQANEVQLAQSEGQINLVLRNKDDQEPARAQTASSRLFDSQRSRMGRIEEDPRPEPVAATRNIDTFLQEQMAAPAAEEPKPVWKLHIFKGEHEDVQEIEYEPKKEFALAVPASDGGTNSLKSLWRLIGAARQGTDQPVPAEEPSVLESGLN